MATGEGLALSEPLHDEDSRSWLKRFEVCAAKARELCLIYNRSDAASEAKEIQNPPA